LDARSDREPETYYFRLTQTLADRWCFSQSKPHAEMTERWRRLPWRGPRAAGIPWDVTVRDLAKLMGKRLGRPFTKPVEDQPPSTAILFIPLPSRRRTPCVGKHHGRLGAARWAALSQSLSCTPKQGCSTSNVLYRKRDGPPRPPPPPPPHPDVFFTQKNRPRAVRQLRIAAELSRAHLLCCDLAQPL